jgi:hypothetical protein
LFQEVTEDHESITDDITVANSPRDVRPPSSQSSTCSKGKRKSEGRRFASRSSEKDLIDLASTTLKKFRASPEVKTDDEFDITGKKLACDLRTISVQQRVIAENIFSDVIYYGKLSKLNEHSSFQVDTPPLQHHMAQTNFHPGYATTHISTVYPASGSGAEATSGHSHIPLQLQELLPYLEFEK